MDANGSPQLSVWRSVDGALEGGWPYITAVFPDPPGAVCDAWCYETPGLAYVGSRALPDGGVELTHAWEGHGRNVVTTATPGPGSVRIVARLAEAAGETYPDLNVCWQVRRSPAFTAWPDPYPAFAGRCFIFTPQGLTFLEDTTRLPIPCRTADDRYNNPPWVQMYLPARRPSLVAGPDSWAAYSPDHYLHDVIGVVSRDRRHLAAIATPNSTFVAQAWHDCLHNHGEWAPDPAGSGRIWQFMIYVLPNDPAELLRRLAADLPKARETEKWN